MNTHAKDIASRVRSFSQEVIDFVNAVPDRDWNKPCEAEQWSVASTAFHIGAGHLAIYEMAQMVINGDGLPPLDMDQIIAMANKQASDNANCSKADVLAQINANRDKMIDFLSGLDDAALEIKGSMPAFDGEVTVAQLIEFVLFQSAADHLQSIKTTVGI